MHLLSIQGKYAPAFQLPDSAAENLKRHLESESKSNVLIISTRFRSDLIYQDFSNNLVSSLKEWSKSVNYPYTDGLKMKFFRSDKESTSLNYYFSRLNLIRRIPGWYNAYLDKLWEVLQQNPQNPLSEKLSESMEIYLDALERQKIKNEQEQAERQVNCFINLKKLIASNKNYN